MARPLLFVEEYPGTSRAAVRGAPIRGARIQTDPFRSEPQEHAAGLEFYPQETWVRVWDRADPECPHVKWLSQVIDRPSVSWWHVSNCNCALSWNVRITSMEFDQDAGPEPTNTPPLKIRRGIRSASNQRSPDRSAFEAVFDSNHGDLPRDDSLAKAVLRWARHTYEP
eukprot:Polyplicarium_translucidae@DN2284_c0_g1_i10.p1